MTRLMIIALVSIGIAVVLSACDEPSKEQQILSQMEFAKKCEAAGKIEAALRAYEEVLRLDPRNEQARKSLDRLKMQTKGIDHP